MGTWIQRSGSQGNRYEGQQMTPRKAEHFSRPISKSTVTESPVSQVRVISNFYRKLSDIWEFLCQIAQHPLPPVSWPFSHHQWEVKLGFKARCIWLQTLYENSSIQSRIWKWRLAGTGREAAVRGAEEATSRREEKRKSKGLRWETSGVHRNCQVVVPVVQMGKEAVWRKWYKISPERWGHTFQ